MLEAKLNETYRIGNFIDSFALGHYARVLDAVDRRNGRPVAFKVLRPEHLTYGTEPTWEFRAFAVEADLLRKMSGSEHVVRLLDCGFIATEAERPVASGAPRAPHAAAAADSCRARHSSHAANGWSGLGEAQVAQTRALGTVDEHQAAHDHQNCAQESPHQ